MKKNIILWVFLLANPIQIKSYEFRDVLYACAAGASLSIAVMTYFWMYHNKLSIFIFNTRSNFKYSDTKTFNTSLEKAFGLLNVINKNGPVIIQARNADNNNNINNTIKATIKYEAKDKNILEELKKSRSISVNNDTYTLMHNTNNMWNNFAIHISLSIPHGYVPQNIQNSNGRISYTGNYPKQLPENICVLNTTNGTIEGIFFIPSSIENNNMAQLSARTVNGKILLDNPGGDVYAQTSNASINATNVHQSITASTTNSSINIHCSDEGLGIVSATTSNGKIRADNVKILKNATTSNGKIEITTHQDLDPAIVNIMCNSCSTTNGGVWINGQKKEKRHSKFNFNF